MEIEKLNEILLGEALKVIYPKGFITKQKRIKINNRILIIDFEVLVNGEQIFVEFDGPTHYTSTKTQLRDIFLNNYCEEMSIKVIHIPYFIQLDSRSIYCLFDIHNNDITSLYLNGFYDSKIVLPGDFNSFGWELFLNIYKLFISKDCFSISKEIWESLIDLGNNNLVFGVDCYSLLSKVEFINNYPT